jgi:hypothetical protein
MATAHQSAALGQPRLPLPAGAGRPAAVAAALVLLPTPAGAAKGSFNVTPKTVRAGQAVKAYGNGCPSRAFVRIRLDGRVIDLIQANRAGSFNTRTEIPDATTPDERRLSAGRPDRKPVASLDGHPLALTSQPAKGKGFTATATIPRQTSPGRHLLSAACDAGSAGTTELRVIDPAGTDPAAHGRG